MIRKRTKNRLNALMQKRRQEKGGELLFSAWESLSAKNLKRSLSQYNAAVTQFGASFEAVKRDLLLAKRRGFLPQNFQVPENVQQLKALFEK